MVLCRNDFLSVIHGILTRSACRRADLPTSLIKIDNVTVGFRVVRDEVHSYISRLIFAPKIILFEFNLVKVFILSTAGFPVDQRSAEEKLWDLETLG